jgi:hypothetical protein
MMRTGFKQLARLLLLVFLAGNLVSCNSPQVYGSIGVSSYGNIGSSGRVSGSISIGGRIR